MQNFEKKLKRILSVSELVVVICLSSASIVVVTYDVINRYLFSNAFPWTQEIIKMFYIWFCFFALSWSMREGKGGIMGVSYLEGNLKGKKKKFILVLKNLISIIFYILFIHACTRVVIIAILQKGSTPYLGIPMWIVYLGCLLGITFTLIRTIIQTKDIIRKEV